MSKNIKNNSSKDKRNEVEELARQLAELFILQVEEEKDAKKSKQKND